MCSDVFIFSEEAVACSSVSSWSNGKGLSQGISSLLEIVPVHMPNAVFKMSSLTECVSCFPLSPSVP